MIGDKAIAEVRRRINAGPERVFAAFADPEVVCQWLSPSPDITLTVLQFDFRVGGGYRFQYRLPDGTSVIVGGVYRIIEAPRKIVFSWIIEPPDEHADIESEVTVTFAPAADRCDLEVRHEKLGRIDAVQRHSAGWRGALDQLAERLSGTA